jgi:eukaryotic-like serine/threonine-protein kinase
MNPDTDVVLGGRYQLGRRIAAGGMGEVWEATDEVLDRRVAVKILRREYADDATFLERFRAEARHAASLSHHGIAAVYDYGEDDGSPFIVMEMVDGDSLADLLSREGRLSPERTLGIVAQTASALQVAHDGGVIHRDVKPGNLLVTADGTVKVTDFGIARATNAVPLTRTGAIMGTAYYISPEQASGQPVTPSSDLYSLGVVAYECLSGRRPFDGHTPVSVALAQVSEEPPALPSGVPEPVAALVMRMLAKEPEGRPASAGELGREAKTLAASDIWASTQPLTPPDPSATRLLETGAVTQPPPRDDGPAPWSGRRPAWLPYAAVLVAALLLALLTVRACSPDETGTPTADGSATQTQAQPATVTVDEAAYVGEPLEAVRAELTELGLVVDVEQVGGKGDPGTVAAVQPDGEVPVGDTVTVSVYREPAGGDDGRGKPDKDEKDDEGEDDEKDEDKGKGDDKKKKKDERKGDG